MCTQLLEEATLIAHPLIENTYICQQVAEVLAGAIPEGLRLFIDILLKGSERYFEAYKVHFYLFDSDVSWFVSVSTATLRLAVSMNKQILTILTDDVWYKCKDVYFSVCPTALVMTSEGHNIV